MKAPHVVPCALILLLWRVQARASVSDVTISDVLATEESLAYKANAL